MNKYIISFGGRENGAIGVFHNITTEFTSPVPLYAIYDGFGCQHWDHVYSEQIRQMPGFLSVYDKYEHIQGIRIIERI